MKRWIFSALFVLCASVSAAQDGRPIISYDESKIKPYTLPEMLIANDGTPITTTRQWERIRRQELLTTFAQELYGSMPEGKVKQHFRVLKTDPSFAAGRATHKTVEMTFKRGSNTHSAIIHVYTPNRVKYAPMFMFFCGEISEPMPWFEQLLDAGFGLCTGDNNQFFPDRQNDPQVYAQSVLSLWGYTAEGWRKGRC